MREIRETKFARSLCREMALGDKKIEKDLLRSEDKIDMRKNGVHISFTGREGQKVPNRF